MDNRSGKDGEGTRLALPQVTLCAATSTHIAATVMALERCLAACDFARVLLFTDQPVPSLPGGIELIRIGPLRSVQDYSHFVLHRMSGWIDSSHCLIAQWDGFVRDAAAWDPAFLDYDYIGAPWPHFDDGHNVGNGGFSLRSKRLMEACNDPGFADSGGAEDVVVARDNRIWLEQSGGFRFADETLAARFSFERSGGQAPTFGFHGVFNLPRVIGTSGFWDIYRTLDNFTSLDTDFFSLLSAVARGPHGLTRAATMIRQRIARLARGSV